MRFGLEDVNTPPYGRVMTTQPSPEQPTGQSGRLTPEAWIQAGFRALARKGASALKAEALARDVGTTKGSFYWHFGDIADFKMQMLRHWEERAFDDIVSELDALPDPPQRLRHLCALAVSFRDPAYGGAAGEPALRAWGREDGNVSEAVSRMDARRLAYLEVLCKDCGLLQPDAAALLYAATLGYESLVDAAPEAAVRGMMTLLDALGLPRT